MFHRGSTATVLLVAAAMLVSVVPAGWAGSAQDGSCELSESQQMTAGLAGEQVDGVSHTVVTIPTACQGEPFTLTGSNPGDDFDICFNDADGGEIRCSTAAGDEASTIPAGAVEGEITYWSGAMGTYTLTAPVGGVGEDAATGPVDLFFHSSPSGQGHVDAAAGTHAMNASEPTKTTPSAWSSAYGVSGDGVDANWAWTPEDGFVLDHAPVETTFFFTAPDQVRRGIDWAIHLRVDGETVASTEAVSQPGAPGEVIELTASLGEVTATGTQLTVEIDAIYANEAVNAILYDSVDTPSRLHIGENLQDDQPPSQVDVSATSDSATRVKLAWTQASDNEGVDHYRVHRGTSSDDLAPVATADATSYTDTDLSPETTYYYQVQAVDVAGNAGPLSDLVAATTPAEDEVNVEPRPVTVVALTDSGYSPYHYDFLGHQHPWNTDADTANDLDFRAHPSTYIEGYPAGSQAIDITIPTSPDASVDDLRAQDQAAWDAVASSSGSGEDVELHWIPGTKIIGAIQYGDSFVASNSAHGTRSAASAAGNIHGACSSCLFVLIEGLGNAGVTWAAEQPWIDVVSNSWGACFATCYTRAPYYAGDPPTAWRNASEDGQFVVFSAGNGLANAFAAPQVSYLNSRNGADWIVGVGAVSPSSKSTYSGSAKPVDISSIGSSYPSTGGSTATGTGTHSGTSNAAPVAAGYLAEVIQRSRELLGDVTPGHAGGVVAEGTPVSCGSAVPDCPLGDGELTRSEARDLVFKNVQPSEGQAVGTVWPNTPYNYAYQGHGVLFGRIDGPGPYEAQVEQMMANATGQADHLERPEGEEAWFTMDSKCRQHLWGEWDGGYYQGEDRAMDPTTDAPAMALDAWCTTVMPEGALR